MEHPVLRTAGRGLVPAVLPEGYVTWLQAAELPALPGKEGGVKAWEYVRCCTYP